MQAIMGVDLAPSPDVTAVVVVTDALAVARHLGTKAGSTGVWKDQNPYHPDSAHYWQWERAREAAYKELLKEVWEQADSPYFDDGGES